MVDGVQPAAAGGAPEAEGYEGKGGTSEEDKGTPTPSPGTTGKPWKEAEGGTEGAEGAGVMKAEEEEAVEGRKEGACGQRGRTKPGGRAAAKEGKPGRE